MNSILIIVILQNIQSIALLDIRLFNLDRHENNLLVCSSWSHSCTLSSHHVIPIDHGYCLPRKTTRVFPQWCWLHWNHSKVPLSQEMKDYLLHLDIENDIAIEGFKIHSMNLIGVSNIRQLLTHYGYKEIN